MDSLQIIGYSGGSSAANYDLTTQLGFIVMLANRTGSCVPLLFRSYKARRVVRSALAAELIAFVEFLDAIQNFAFGEELRSMHHQSEIFFESYTDNKSLLYVISKGTRKSEKRLMLHISAAREGFREKEICDIGFVRTARNLADVLTK